MDMRDEWIAALRAWAANNDCVRELWLFGSRANGTPPPDSDIDIALALMPPSASHCRRNAGTDGDAEDALTADSRSPALYHRYTRQPVHLGGDAWSGLRAHR